ncbi:amyloid-beta A4 precursor protein-binding family A member 2 isoform X2 [Pimephales promelas]|uniref:amyloid-beta A4 precursor protein-binding family A member 2 isoform X2 n=1 Tax=Pimephales promelas TaxID=90988 RepID=UPI0019556BEA|nr:amyloid-beta A4 precursor protein-binding family A member 2 isoform X2 [Pimephales promelas]KAG1939416.1 amyloid-beta A4 precursor protein-binding family A [Pimephales promelas]
MKLVMALMRRTGTRAIVSELNPSASSTAPERSEKLNGDGVDPIPEQLQDDKLDIRPSSPTPAGSFLSDGSGDDSIPDESPLSPDSMEEDSLSEYDNVGSGEEEEEEEEERDYEEDEELQTEADRMTYYVHCCPEDESYMEGMDCHEGADGAECPGTSREVRDGCTPEEAWKHSENFSKIPQKDAPTMVYKRPEPITETTFVQAPMAEDEEDEEETEEEVEEDSEEEDNDYFHYVGNKVELNNNKVPHKVFLRDNRSRPQESSHGKLWQESDSVNNSKRNQDISKHPRDFPPGSSCSPMNPMESVQEECASVCPKDCDVPVVRECRGDTRQTFRFRGHNSERVHNRDIAYQDSSKANNKATFADSEDRGAWKKRRLLKYSREDDRDGDGKHSHEQSKSPRDSKNRGHDHPVCNHKPKGEQKTRSYGDVEEDQIVLGVKTKLKIAPNNSWRNKDQTLDQTNNGKGAPDSSRASSTSSGRGKSQSRAHVNTPVQSPDKWLHKDVAKPVQKEKTRPSQEQVPQSSPVDSSTEPPSGQKKPIQRNPSFPSFVDIPGPCEPEDLINGIIFAANYLGSTQLLSERNPSKSVRMKQAQEAVDFVKSEEGEAQSLTEIDLFISTKAIKVLNADTQETMMDNALRTISYIADIGSVVVLMARRRLSNSSSLDCTESDLSTESQKQYRMMCYVFESEDAQLIAQSIGQAFSMAYQEFLQANGINPKDLSQKDYSDILNTQEMYNDDLIHFSNSENLKELQLEKQKGEILGMVIVESGWGSILPTVILACMLNNSPAARSGKLNVGDQIMAVNDTSLVGLPLATCQGIIKGLKNHVQVKLSVVSCPPVTTVLIKRPDLQYQLGFSVQNGIICSLMRGGIAERGGVRVGHRIIEINGQSVVAMAHEKIVHALSVSIGEISMKTMPAVMFRLLTGQETPVYI